MSIMTKEVLIELYKKMNGDTPDILVRAGEHMERFRTEKVQMLHGFIYATRLKSRRHLDNGIGEPFCGSHKNHRSCKVLKRWQTEMGTVQEQLDFGRLCEKCLKIRTQKEIEEYFLKQ